MHKKNNLINPINKFAALDSDSDDDVKSKTEPKITITNNIVKNNSTNNTVKNDNTNKVNSVEDTVFQKYFSKSKKSNNYQPKIPLDNGFTLVNKKEKPIVHQCEIKNINENLLTDNTLNKFKVLVHHNDDKNWDYLSYHNITTITKWEDIPQFFNVLNTANGECKFTDFDTFIMKNDISPMWEDLENRNGSICSIKIDSVDEAYKILKVLLVYIANNTLLKFNPNTWDVVNGLSFSPKKMDHINMDNSLCIIIKIWFKINMSSYNNSIEKALDNKINELLNKYSIKVKPIKPEY
jgi:hypothetical protein